MLGEQAAITVEGDGGARRLGGRRGRGGRPAAPARARADEHKRELREALTEAFSTPLEPEDIFELSRGLDEILNSAKNIVGEAEAMQTAPDAATAEMAARAGRRAPSGSPRRSRCSPADDRDGATAERRPRRSRTSATSSTATAAAMSALVDVEDLREIAARRELYRRLARTGDDLVRVAERIWYSVLKES